MSLDAKLFEIVNTGHSNPIFDQVMPFVSNLYKGWGAAVFLVGLVLYLTYRLQRNVPWMILGLVLAVGSADLIGHRVLKANIQRERPTTVLENVNLLVAKHSGFSFPSNHAANSFAGATLIALALPSAGAVFLTYAAVVAYSRVYVGVHYPFDVLAGAILGVLTGALTFLILKRRLRPPPVRKAKS